MKRHPIPSEPMPLRPIRDEADYDRALSEIDRLMGAEVGSPEGDRLDVLSLLVEAYEDIHDPMPPPDDPIVMLEHHLESRGLTRKDLEPYLGSRARVAEILNRRRGLTIQMIRKLHDGLGLPAEVLIRPYPLQTRAR